MTQCHGVILAGGQARRMGGQDKALVALAGRPLLDWVIERLDPQVGQVWVSANGAAERFSAYGLPVLPDDPGLGNCGPLGGILMALEAAAAQGAPAVLSVPVDTPLIPHDILATFLKAQTKGAPLQACYAYGARAHYAIALWPVRVAAALRRFLQSGAKPRLADFLDIVGGIAVQFADFKGFQNLNSPDDLREFEQLLRDQS